MLEFILAVFLIELTPGPNMAYLATLAVAWGRTAALYAVLGVSVGLSVQAVVTAFGAGKLLLHYPWLYEALRWAGVGYLVFLAWEGWQPEKENSPGRTNLDPKSGSSLFLRGFLSNIFNPKSLIFFVSVVPTFVEGAPGGSNILFQIMVFGIVYVGIATAVHAAIVMLASKLRPWLVQGPRQHVVRRILSLAIVFVAVWLYWSTKR